MSAQGAVQMKSSSAYLLEQLTLLQRPTLISFEGANVRLRFAPPMGLPDPVQKILTCMPRLRRRSGNIKSCGLYLRLCVRCAHYAHRLRKVSTSLHLIDQ